MALKKYTLYYKGENKYGHFHFMPIISMDLLSVDKYTSNYENNIDLFNSLPLYIKNFIKDNLCNNIDIKNDDDLKKCFCIADKDFNVIMDVIFKKDIDVIYINKDEVDKNVLELKMSYSEYRSILANVNRSSNVKRRYDFFKYLYDLYVKDKKLKCMIDVYDASNEIPNIKEDDLLLAALSTNKDNIMILCKKLEQNDESRRNLAFKYKELFSKVNGNSKIITNKTIMDRKNKGLILENLISQIEDNFYEFKNKYEKEYK